MPKQTIVAEEIGGSYSTTTVHATSAAGLVFVTGQVANRPDSSPAGDPLAQVELGGWRSRFNQNRLRGALARKAGMTTNSNDGTLSRALWEARRDGRQVRVDEQDRPRDEASAYAVQRGATEASGFEIVGYKIGATAQFAMDLLGVSGPFFGPLYREAFRENDAAVSLPMAHSPGIESEFAVSLAADLPQRSEAWTKEEVEAVVAWVGPAFEIVGTRLESGLPGAGMLVIADGGANIDFVRGPAGTAWRDADLTAHPVTLRINGEEVASGNSGMLVFGDPISGVVWLANHPELGVRGLKAGDVVTTGTCTGITPLSPGDEAEADYGALGTVRARFSS